MATWKNIIVHCSASGWGSEREIQKWHQAKGWRTTGYHFVINNGHILTDLYIPLLDGHVELGREVDGDTIAEEDEAGAHAYGMNTTSIGICLIGQNVFTFNQLESLRLLLEFLCLKFNIPSKDVLGHYETPSAGEKTCPNINMNDVRQDIGLIEKYTI